MGERSEISTRKSLFVLFTFVPLALSIFLLIFWGAETEEKAMPITNTEFEFVTVENPDSSKYMTVISPLKAVDILVVSKYFYQHEEYWSYIHRDNNLDNLLHISAGAVIKIPFIDSLGEKNSLTQAKLLGDTLLKKYSPTKK